MSENIPESIPTSVSNRSHRPLKKRALTPVTQQSAQVRALFANPDPDRIENSVAREKKLTAPPEVVANVQGSSAGAGSGEFHVYKASRRREYERLRTMDEELQADEAEKQFQQRKDERERKDMEKLSKNRAKREKAKQRQAKKKAGSAGDMEVDGEAEKENGEAVKKKKKLTPAKCPNAVNGAGLFDEERDAEAAQEEAGLTIHDDD